ncbi:MAG: DUF1385 domain-containing protein [Candidatus Marinimicrobia bacterium]|nr:DUF1385 domain-containing protein [Candidatus Neomarinimicrobiota bacterium]
MNEPILVGGQAVIEGVLMRGPDGYAVSVRNPNGEIETIRKDYKSLTKRYKFLSLPLIRGIISLYESLKIGLEALQFSAKVFEEKSDIKKESLKEKIYSFLSFSIAIVVAFVFFFYLPILLTTKLFNIEQKAALFNLSSGLLRIGFFVAYLIFINFLKDIKRIFQYHGAEHQVVFAFENGEELNVENAKKYSTHHPRCGTSFIFVMLIFSIVTFAIIDTIIILIKGNITIYNRLFYHFILLLPVLGISYELLKITSRNQNNIFIKILSFPGLALQRITTHKPSNDQLEVAITALKSSFGDNFEKYSGKKFTAKAIE